MVADFQLSLVTALKSDLAALRAQLANGGSAQAT